MIGEVATPANRREATPTGRRVLFVNANSSGTAQVAEAWLHKLGADKFEVSSASLVGSGPIHDLASRVTADCGRLSLSAQRPADNWWWVGEHWDFVIALRDRSQAGNCPVCAVVHACIHWDCPDPALVGTNEDAHVRAFERTCRELLTRIRLFVAWQTRIRVAAVAPDSVDLEGLPPGASDSEKGRSRRAPRGTRRRVPARLAQIPSSHRKRAVVRPRDRNLLSSSKAAQVSKTGVR